MLSENQGVCDDYGATTTVKILPYGSGKMAEIDCPRCGIGYDTNLDEKDGE
jgi:hypothetical protein